MIKQETLCTRCAHLKVCKYISDMESARQRAELMDAKEPIAVTVICSSYKQDSGTIRG